MCLVVGELSVVQLNSEAARSHGESVTFVQPATQTGVYRSQSAVLVPSRTSTSCFYSCMRTQLDFHSVALISVSLMMALTEPVAAAHTAVQSVLNPDHSEFSTVRSDSRTVLGLYSHSSRVPAYQ